VTLDAAARHAQGQWPDVRVDAAEFVPFLLARLPEGVSREALAALSIDELYLAFACLRGDPAALAIFDEKYLGQVGAFIAHIDRSPAFADEVRQRLRDKLLVGRANDDAGEPALAAYRGRGGLGGFVRISALRIALNLRRHDRRTTAREQAASLPELGVGANPELAYLRDQYREVFADALRAAVAELSDRDRTILRLYHADGLALEALGALYRVHLSTVSRWLLSARERIGEETLRRVREQLRVGVSDAESIAALVMSQLDVSLVRLFRDAR